MKAEKKEQKEKKVKETRTQQVNEDVEMVNLDESKVSLTGFIHYRIRA
jgi:hypothetical protein